MSRGSLWSAVGLVLPLVASLVATPYLIRYFGASEWGIIALVQSICVFLVAFDGGIGLSAMRFFAVHAGRDDRTATTQLVFSLAVLVVVVTVVASAVAWFVVPAVIPLLRISPSLEAPTKLLLRMIVPLVGAGVLRGLLASLINAYRGFAATTVANTVSALAWVASLAVIDTGHLSFRYVALGFAAEALVGLAIVAPGAFDVLSPGRGRLLDGPSLRAFCVYSAKMQLGGIFAVVNFGFDALLIAAVLPIKDVAYYDLGAGLALQLRGAAAVALTPAVAALGRAYGASPSEAEGKLRGLQRSWIVCLTGWSAAALGSLYFGATAWLGPGFRAAGIVAVVLMVGYAANLWNGMAASYAMAIGRPDLIVRVVAVTTLVNVAATLPGLLLGLYGIVGATTVALVVGNLYLIPMFRRRLAPDFPSALDHVPAAPAALTLLTTVGLELVIRPVVPTGPLGLVACLGPPLVGLGLFTVVHPVARTMARRLIAPVIGRALPRLAPQPSPPA